MSAATTLMTREALPQNVKGDLPLVSASTLLEAKSKKVQLKDYNNITVDISGAKRTNCIAEDLMPKKIYNSALDLVGRTPLIRLDRIAKKFGIECELLGKCEFFSVGGSVKDRIGKMMVDQAEKDGRLKEGGCLVEATSGNTGVGLAIAAAVKNYRLLITMPEKMSQEKLNAMRALGAEIIRTPTEAAWNDPDSHITLAAQLAETVPDCIFIDQYSNPANPQAHYLGTAEEILFQTDAQIDMFVATAGTGGTISGIAKKLKERVPSCQIVGVDPEGSILALPASLSEPTVGQGYEVEGIGYDFIPSTLNRGFVDRWVKSNDIDSFRAARQLVALEGLMVGGSSGSALAGALEMARTLQKGQRCVVLLPDGARNYMSKFMSDEWMEDKGFMKVPMQLPYRAVAEKVESKGSVESYVPCVEKNNSFNTTLSEMNIKNNDVCVVFESLATGLATADVVGIVTRKEVLTALITGRFTTQSPIGLITNKKPKKVTGDLPLESVARSLRLNDAVLVVDPETMLHLKGVLRVEDVLEIFE